MASGYTPPASSAGGVSSTEYEDWLVLTFERPPEAAGSIASSEEKLTKRPWFQGRMSRAVADDRLSQSQRFDGTFLMRESDAVSVRNDPVYVMSVMHDGTSHHMEVVQREDGKYALGGVRGAKAFKTLDKLVAHYRKKNMDLDGGGRTKLKYYLD